MLEDIVSGTAQGFVATLNLLNRLAGLLEKVPIAPRARGGR